MPTSNVHSSGQTTVRPSFPYRPPRARKTALNRHFLTTGKFEPAPLSSPPRKSPVAAQESCRAEGHRRTGRSTESGTQPSECGHHRYARSCRCERVPPVHSYAEVSISFANSNEVRGTRLSTGTRPLGRPDRLWVAESCGCGVDGGKQSHPVPAFPALDEHCGRSLEGRDCIICPAPWGRAAYRLASPRRARRSNVTAHFRDDSIPACASRASKGVARG